MPSRSELYFSELKAKGAGLYDHLAAMKDSVSPVQESEYLDFKGCEKIDEKTIKHRWAAALSGFGNTEGGVIVWGLDARKDSNDIDRVIDLSPSPDVHWLEQCLRQNLYLACDPPLFGVEFLKAPQPGKKLGFVVACIPEGQMKPHRAEIGPKEFHIRVGDSFKVPNVSILRSMFFSKHSPVLKPYAIFQADGDGAWMKIRISNTGTATAELIWGQIYHRRDLNIFRIQVENRALLFSEGHRSMVEMPGHLNPSQDGLLIRITFEKRSDLIYPGAEAPERFRLMLSCRDTPATYWKIDVTHYDLIREESHSRPFEVLELQSA